jgi:hypothetical protein
MPRFVLLRHEMPPSGEIPSHWDLMFQQGDSLLTWRLEALPAGLAPAEPSPVNAGRSHVSPPIVAVRLAEHRLEYLDYEGPVSGDRGEVRRVDGGEYTSLVATPTQLHVQLEGAVLRCCVLLEHVAGDQWRLHVDDRFSG